MSRTRERTKEKASPFDFLDRETVSALNQLLENQGEVRPREVCEIRRCKREEGMLILLYLYHLNKADPYLLIHHNAHIGEPVEERPLILGLPKIPYLCPGCLKEVEDKQELSFDCLFRLKGDARFAWKKKDRRAA